MKCVYKPSKNPSESTPNVAGITAFVTFGKIIIPAPASAASKEYSFLTVPDILDGIELVCPLTVFVAAAEHWQIVRVRRGVFQPFSMNPDTLTKSIMNTGRRICCNMVDKN
jgi:hypothetical protein